MSVLVSNAVAAHRFPDVCPAGHAIAGDNTLETVKVTRAGKERRTLHCRQCFGTAPPAGRRGVEGYTLKAVALGIATRANNDWAGAHPSIRELAEYTQFHTHTVGRAIRALIELDYLEITERGTKRLASVYAFNRDAFTIKQGRGRAGRAGAREIGTTGARTTLEDGTVMEYDGERWQELAQ